jgi:hypothetical protein
LFVIANCLTAQLIRGISGPPWGSFFVAFLNG